EAISCLQGFWSALSGSTSKLSSTVTTDQLYPWVVFEPGREGSSLTIREQIHWDAILQIDENRAVLFAPAIGPFIHAKDSWRLDDRRRRVAHDSQNGRTRARHAERRAQGGS